jgi:hypothetical protein
MSWNEERKTVLEERRRRLAGAVPGNGPLAWLDSNAWAAMAQDDPARFSWAKVAITIGAGLVLAVIIFLTFFDSPSFLIGLSLAYLFLLWRAYSVHRRYVRVD